jgi:trk system potassium uptake protein TrkA
MYMILVGGGNVGLYLAKRLLASGHEVLLLERDPRTVQKLATIVGEENVMLGDGCEMLTQRDAGFSRADVVVAVTGEDEDNLVICQMAKMVWNVDRVLARVNDPGREAVFKQIGIDQTVSATGIIHALIEQQISPDCVVPVGALARGDLEIVEVELGNRSPVVHQRIRDLKLPPLTNIIWILRNDQGIQVSGDTELLPHDTIVAVISREHAEDLRNILLPERF